jgi:Tfp pilus assembly protein PilO
VSPGIGVRLADATPWIVLDVLVPGLALLLLSRVWVMVAPGLGRRLGRRALVFGLPLLLVASVAGHVAAPEAALALSDGIDFTAFVLCLPLGAVWLGALLYRLARWLLGRRVAAPPRELTRAAEWLRLGAVMLPVAMAVGLVQWDAARDEVKATQRRALELRTTIRALEATERKADEFARERRLLAEKLEVLHEITPRSPEIAELVSRLQAQAGAYQLQILEWSSTAGEPGAVLLEHEITLVVVGELERVKDFVLRTGKLSRLLTWQRITVRARRATARVSSYSAPERETAPPRDVCAHPRSKVWLWPYTAKVRVARAEVDSLCAERERHAETRAQVDDFQSRRARLTDLIQAIEKVRKEWRVPEIVVEEGPPPEAPPLPTKTT